MAVSDYMPPSQKTLASLGASTDGKRTLLLPVTLRAVRQRQAILESPVERASRAGEGQKVHWRQVVLGKL